MDKKHKETITTTLVATVITGICAICAATIGLGVPVVDKYLDSRATPILEFYAPTLASTPIPITPSNLPSGVEIFPGKHRKVYSINWQYPNNRTVDVIDIYVQCLNCSEPDFQVTHGTGYYEYPTWSPQGTMIAALKGKCGSQELVILSSDGSWEQTVQGVNPLCRDISWSPLGDEIAYSGYGPLMAVDINTGRNRVIATAEKIQGKDIDVSRISWSSDGKKLTFWTRLGSGDNYQSGYTIWVVNSDGSNLVKISPPKGYVQTDSHWITNQDQLVFHKHRTNENDINQYELWTIRSDGTNPQPVLGSISIRANLYYPPYLDCSSTTAIYCDDWPWEPDDFDDNGEPSIIN